MDVPPENRREYAKKYGGNPNDYAAWYKDGSDNAKEENSGYLKVGEERQVQGVIFKSLR